MDSNVASDALCLATNLLNSLLPDKDWGIVNIVTDDRDMFTLGEYPSIPVSFGYKHDNTPVLLEQYGVIEGETLGWWYVGIKKHKSQWGRIRPQELTIDDGISWVAQDKQYIAQDQIIEYYYHVLSEDIGPRKHGQMAVLLNKQKLTEFIKQFSQDRVVNAPKDRDHWYEKRIIFFRLADKSVDFLDFSKAHESRKYFETFYNLWTKNPLGIYQYADIQKEYKRITKDDLVVRKIGKMVSNIKRTIIYPKPLIAERIVWEADRKDRYWNFKILPLKH